jgi:hypothetical protein
MPSTQDQQKIEPLTEAVLVKTIDILEFISDSYQYHRKNRDAHIMLREFVDTLIINANPTNSVLQKIVSDMPYDDNVIERILNNLPKYIKEAKKQPTVDGRSNYEYKILKTLLKTAQSQSYNEENFPEAALNYRDQHANPHNKENFSTKASELLVQYQNKYDGSLYNQKAVKDFMSLLILLPSMDVQGVIKTIRQEMQKIREDMKYDDQNRNSRIPVLPSIVQELKSNEQLDNQGKTVSFSEKTTIFPITPNSTQQQGGNVAKPPQSTWNQYRLQQKTRPLKSQLTANDNKATQTLKSQLTANDNKATQTSSITDKRPYQPYLAQPNEVQKLPQLYQKHNNPSQATTERDRFLRNIKENKQMWYQHSDDGFSINQ